MENELNIGYILVWYINDYPDNGGGLDWAIYENESKGLDKINELNAEWGYKFELKHFSYFSHKIEVEPIRIITEYKIK